MYVSSFIRFEIQMRRYFKSAAYFSNFEYSRMKKSFLILKNCFLGFKIRVRKNKTTLKIKFYSKYAHLNIINILSGMFFDLGKNNLKTEFILPQSYLIFSPIKVESI